LADAALYIALERGYFAEEALALELADVNGPDRLFPALTSGQVVASTAGLSAAIFNGLGRGLPIKIVAPLATNAPGASGSFVMVRTDLFEDGAIAGYADFRGRRVAKPGNGDSADYVLGLILERGGLHQEEVDVTVLGSAEAIPALANKVIDAAIFSEPNSTIAENLGVAVKWRSCGDISPGLQAGVVLFASAFVSSQADVGRRWMAAYLRGVRDYYAALRRPGGRQELAPLLARHTAVRDLSLYDRMDFVGYDPNLQLNEASLAEQLAWHTREGLVTVPVDLQQAVDRSFVQYALERLGTYR
jgi:NitT/TauT family transport system substrate-binding protein